MFKVDVKVELSDIDGKVGNALDHGQFKLDQMVLSDSNYYIPKDQGYLEESSLTHSKPGEGEVVWQTPYARRHYYNPQYNFSKDKNSNAQGLWFEAAKAKNLRTWLDQAEKETKKNI